jgi:hypothetical protein
MVWHFSPSECGVVHESSVFKHAASIRITCICLAGANFQEARQKRYRFHLGCRCSVHLCRLNASSIAFDGAFGVPSSRCTNGCDQAQSEHRHLAAAVVGDRILRVVVSVIPPIYAHFHKSSCPMDFELRHYPSLPRLDLQPRGGNHLRDQRTNLESSASIPASFGRVANTKVRAEKKGRVRVAGNFAHVAAARWNPTRRVPVSKIKKVASA